MIESDVFVQALQDIGVDFFTGVPDSILGGIIAEFRRIEPMARQEFSQQAAERIALVVGDGVTGRGLQIHVLV